MLTVDSAEPEGETGIRQSYDASELLPPVDWTSNRGNVGFHEAAGACFLCAISPPDHLDMALKLAHQ
jgi:hypothetical protein